MLLLSLLLIPLVGIFIIYTRMAYMGSNSNFFNNRITSGYEEKIIGLTTLVVNLIVSLVIWILFDFSQNQFQFVQEYHKVSFCDLYLGLDGLSIYFVLLTTIIMPIALLSNWSSIKENQRSFVIIVLLLETLLLGVFLVLDVFLFYIFFESILPPLFLLIGLFGSDNKVRASLYLFLYTLFGSLFLLLAILTMSSLMGTTDFDALFKGNFNYSTQMYLFAGIFLAFAVKTPLIFLNNWLLRAHVESPLSGSIVLAAIVLKLSLYGFLRLILPILPQASLVSTPLVFMICVITIVYASLSTLRTIDIKGIIAYSSVAHAAVYLLGVFSNTIQGIEGGILLGLAHGFVSTGLFMCVGGVLYDRVHTRLITHYRGVTQIMPLFSLLFFILCLGNMGTPLTFNFVGEFLSLYGAFERLPILGALACSSIVLSAAFTIYLYNRIAFGGALSSHFAVNVPDLTKREFVILISLVVPTILFGIYPSPILDGLHYSVSTLIYSLEEVDLFQPLSGAMLLSIPLELNNNSNNKNLDPNYVTGFIDAEGCFHVTIQKIPKRTTGYRVHTVFTIGLHEKDIALLKLVQKFFGVGSITKHGKNSVQYRVSSPKDLKVIVDHISKYPLITQKWADYLLFRQILNLSYGKEHLTIEGLYKIVAIKASMNKGLNENLKADFPNVIPVQRPLVEEQEIKDPNWLAGFVCGEGCFLVGVSKSKLSKSGYNARLNFSIGQHKRDSKLIKNISEYLSCGNLSSQPEKSSEEFIVSKFSDIESKIIPFFNKYPLHGDKSKDFDSFKRVAIIRKNKGHLTTEGLEELLKIKGGMNSVRYASLEDE
jgi:NADH-ubiquinone oxidoreductase chain 4